MEYEIGYDMQVIEFMQRSGQIDAKEAQFMRNYLRGLA